ncbi:hypothetical protein [Coxiella endosymbiont of Rhipicephalus microplus]|uniref:hypothetical protein n=1 Tax=Coxiella endosymbiont of Rhipicephalus microplus TaxID=1656186 RepID=UPI0013001122|nr:hypothetical protein [Coxiella endosymbiont of Rhipicephalus microplus]
MTITDVGVLGFHEERFPNVLLWNIWIVVLTYSSDKRSGNAGSCNSLIVEISSSLS